VLGVPVSAGPAPPTVNQPPLVQVPVTAVFASQTPLTPLLGNQRTLSLAVPVPAFIAPSGTATVATSLTGPVTITNFSVDNAGLGQLTPPTQVPDLPSASPVGPAAPGETPSAPPNTGVVQVNVPPLRFEWLGLRVESSAVQVIATVEHLTGTLLVRTEEIIASVTRTLAQVVSLFAAKLVAAAEHVLSLLPSWFLQALDALHPSAPETVLLAHYQFGPVNVSYQATWNVDPGVSLGDDGSSSSDPPPSLGNGDPSSPDPAPSLGDSGSSLPDPPASLGDGDSSSPDPAPLPWPLSEGQAIAESGEQAQSLSVSEVTVNVYADTGPNNPLGNVLVAADHARGNPGPLDVSAGEPSDEGVSTLASAVSDEVSNELTPLGGSLLHSGRSSLSILVGGAPAPPYFLGIFSPDDAIAPPSSLRWIPSLSGLGGGMDAPIPSPAPAHRKQPAPDQEEGASEKNGSPLDDDNPLPKVLPEVGLPDDATPPQPDVTETVSGGGESEPFPESSRQLVTLTICVPRARRDAGQEEFLRPTNREDGPHPRQQTTATLVAHIRVPVMHEPNLGFENRVDQTRELGLVAREQVCANETASSAGEGQEDASWQCVAGLVLAPSFAIVISPRRRLSTRCRPKATRDH
jgi:hypothetical protein